MVDIHSVMIGGMHCRPQRPITGKVDQNNHDACLQLFFMVYLSESVICLIGLHIIWACTVNMVMS